jgi:predicted Fe-Mo cluster-binding NifX family protein
MSLRKLKIAIPTKGKGGLEDVVSNVFGRANTFTIVDVEKGVIKNVKTLKNPAVSYKHGAGPIVVKMLIDADVNMVLASELGPGASALLEQHNITTTTAKPGTDVENSVKEALSKIEK